jgi:type II secretion system protein G
LKRIKNHLGFTLIEMLIVVTIIGILAAIVMPRFLSTADTARKSAHKTDRQHINSQVELYYFNTGSWPAAGALSNDQWKEPNGEATSWQKYFPDGVPVTCNQGEAWTIDTDTHRLKFDESNHAGHE